jgi:hypothetical protein
MSIEIEIFADEIICPIDFNNNTRNILGICCFFIPVNTKQEIVNQLLRKRCINSDNLKWNYEFDACLNKTNCKESWHKSNDCEIHNQNIRSSRASNSLKTISKKWIKYFIEKNRAEKSIRFNILFIELDKMDISKFGESKIHENMYNKFFRTVINYGVKSFFNNSKVLVKNVYHDKGSMEKHAYFPYLNLYKLNDEIPEVAIFENKDIIFVDSNHKNYVPHKKEYYSESHLIQFVDLILGNISQCLFNLSNDNLKKENATLLHPLVERLINKSRDYYSSWHYTDRQNISLFPKSEGNNFKNKCFDLNGNLVDDFIKEFHKDKTLKMPFYNPEQESLSKFF